MKQPDFEKIPACKNCKVRGQSIFCAIKTLQLDTISQEKGTAYFKKGQVIFYEGNSSLGLYVVHHGLVKLIKTGTIGKEQIIGFAKKADVFGYRALFGNEPHQTTAVAMEDTSICIVPKSIIQQLIREDHDFVGRLLEMESKTIGRLTETLVNIGQMPVRDRLATILLQMVKYFGYKKESTIINLELSREEYANLIATTRESCMRTFSDFKSEGIVGLKGREVEIKNTNALKSIARGYFYKIQKQ